MSSLLPAFVHHLEVRLLERRDELEARLQAAVSAASGHQGSAGDVHDFKDAASEASEAALDEAGQMQAAREHATILAALRRIREGTYGDCEGCGRPIPVHRLEAMPAAALCTACQDLQERRAVR